MKLDRSNFFLAEGVSCCGRKEPNWDGAAPYGIGGGSHSLRALGRHDGPLRASVHARAHERRHDSTTVATECTQYQGEGSVLPLSFSTPAP